jgi:hypothetical protein
MVQFQESEIRFYEKKQQEIYKKQRRLHMFLQEQFKILQFFELFIQTMGHRKYEIPNVQNKHKLM